VGITVGCNVGQGVGHGVGHGAGCPGVRGTVETELVNGVGTPSVSAANESSNKHIQINNRKETKKSTLFILITVCLILIFQFA